MLDPAALLVVVVLAIGLCGFAMLARVLFPGLARRLDLGAESRSRGRELVVGTLLLVGVTAIAAGVGASVQHEETAGAIAFFLYLPLLVLLLLGSIPMFDRVGEGLLDPAVPRSPLVRHLVGGLVVLLVAPLLLVPLLGPLLLLLLCAWPVGLGLGLFGSSSPPAA